MFQLSYLIRFLLMVLASFVRLAITPVKTTVPPGNIEILGAMPTQAGLVGAVTDLTNNAAPAFGNFAQVPLSGVTNTWPAAAMVGGIIRRYGTSSAADLTDTAANIVASIPGAKVGQSFPLFVANLSSGVMTPGAGSGVTLVGTTTITGFAARLFIGTVTGSAAVTLTSCFQFGTNPNTAYGIQA
jgi:hypothetical protein